MTGKGARINHAYARAGKYVVLLSVETSGKEVTERMTLEVVPLEVSLEAEPGGVLGVHNRSKREVDIGGWMLFADGASFYIPLNTVVLPQETLRFIPEVTGLYGLWGSQLLYPSGALATSAVAPEPVVLEDEKVTSKEPAPASSESPPAVEPVREVSISTVAPTSSLYAPAAALAPEPDTREEKVLSAAASQADTSDLPVWSYGLGLGALLVLGAASTLFVQQANGRGRSFSPADEFEIREEKE